MKVLKVSRHFEKIYGEFLKDKGELVSRKDAYVYYLVDDSKEIAKFLYDNSIIEMEGNEKICLKWLNSYAPRYSYDCGMGRILVIDTVLNKTVGIFDTDENWEEKWLEVNGEKKRYQDQDKWTKDIERLYGLKI